MNGHRDLKRWTLHRILYFPNTRCPMHLLNLQIVFQLFVFKGLLFVVCDRYVALTQRYLDVARRGITWLSQIDLQRVPVPRQRLPTVIFGAIHRSLQLLAA